MKPLRCCLVDLGVNDDNRKKWNVKGAHSRENCIQHILVDDALACYVSARHGVAPTADGEGKDGRERNENGDNPRSSDETVDSRG